MRRVGRRTIPTAAVLSVVFVVTSAAPAFAQDATLETLNADLTAVWVGLAAALVFLMQVGFGLLEAGLTRAKNAANIVAKNLVDMSIGAVTFWAVGAAFAYGTGTFLGQQGFFSPVPTALPDGVQFVFQLVFAATAVTIVSGAVAERMKFSGYVIIAIALTAFIYPVVVHWQWPLATDVGAWLYELGYHDFAGSSIVHMTGGVAALVGAVMLGPRVGKYAKDGTTRAIPGHNIPFAVFGVFILWFGWFGFNGGSTLAAGAGQAASIGVILLSTNVAAGAGGVVAGALSWIRGGKFDPSMAGNGVLGGLVAITAGTNFASGGEAAIIGAMAGIIVVYGVAFFDSMKVDDPVGAVSVHGLCGVFGTLVVGVIAAGESNGEAAISLGTQALGVVAIAAWVALATAVVLGIAKATIGIRVSEEEEIEGLDFFEHGMHGYGGDPMERGGGGPRPPTPPGGGRSPSPSPAAQPKSTSGAGT